MKELILSLLRTNNGWIRTALLLLCLTFVAGSYYSTFKSKIESHEKRITNLEYLAENITKIQIDIAEIKGTLNRR